MKKKFILAVATSLVLANGATSAFAAKVSDSDNSDSSTTVVERPRNSRLTAAQQAARKAAQNAATTQSRHGPDSYRVELASYLAQRKAIQTTYKAAIASAQVANKVARKSVRTKFERQAAEKAFREAVSSAQRTFRDSMKDLGAPPAKPLETKDTK